MEITVVCISFCFRSNQRNQKTLIKRTWMLARELGRLLPSSRASRFRKAEKPPPRLLGRWHVCTESSRVILTAHWVCTLSTNFKVPLQKPSAAVQPPCCSLSSRPSLRSIFRFILRPSLPGLPDLPRRQLFNNSKHGRRICQRSRARTRPRKSQQQQPEQPMEVDRLRVQASNLFEHFELGFISSQALWKFPLPSLLKFWASLPQGLTTQRKHPGFWLKGGERPDWRGRERSRSASDERRRKGDDSSLKETLPARAAVDLKRMPCPGNVGRSWSAGGQRSTHGSKPRLSVSSRRRGGWRRRSRDGPMKKELRLWGKRPCCRNRWSRILKTWLPSSQAPRDVTVSSPPVFWLYQREEEQARERAKAEQLRQERELLAQKEDAARQARKKVKPEHIWWKH